MADVRRYVTGRIVCVKGVAVPLVFALTLDKECVIVAPGVYPGISGLSRTMNKRVEVVILAACCLLSFGLGWVMGVYSHNIGVALFFYLLALFFFLAMFRPQSL